MCCCRFCDGGAASGAEGNATKNEKQKPRFKGMVAAKTPEEDENSFTLFLVGGTQVVTGSNLDVDTSMIQTLRPIVRILATTNWN